MNRRASIAAIILVGIFALLLMGWWVGAFETFGGYVTRQRIFLGVSIAIGTAVAWLLNRKEKVHVGLAGAVLVLSQSAYVLGQAFGQAYYAGASGVGDFARTVLAALSNRL